MARLSKMWVRGRGGRIMRRSLMCVLVMIPGACGTRTSYPGQNPFAEGGAAQNIRIRVRNGNFYDASLTAISESGRRRLGTVSGNNTAVYSMPWTFTGRLQIEIDLLAGPTCTTDFITVAPGEDVSLEIMSDFDSTPDCR